MRSIPRPPILLLLLAGLLLLVAACNGDGDAEADGDHSYQDGDVVTFVVPTNPGGGMDGLATAFRPHFEEALREVTGADVDIQIEYMPGGGHLTGMQHVQHEAAPDGRTVILMITTTASGHQIIADEDLDVLAFTPVGGLAEVPLGYIIRRELGIEQGDWQALSEWSQDQSIRMGHPGPEPQMRMMFGLLESEGMPFNVDYVQVDGSAEMTAAALRDEVDLFMGAAFGIRPHADDNPDELEMFATAGCTREASGQDDVPTVVDSELPQAEVICNSLMTEWRSIFAPPDLDPADAAVLQEAVELGHGDAFREEFFEVGGFEAAHLPPDGLTDHVQGLQQAWQDLVQYVD